MDKMPISCPFCSPIGLILLAIGIVLLFLNKGISADIGIAFLIISYFTPILKRGVIRLGHIIVKR
jgi:hypothetical protein